MLIQKEAVHDFEHLSEHRFENHPPRCKSTAPPLLRNSLRKSHLLMSCINTLKERPDRWSTADWDARHPSRGSQLPNLAGGIVRSHGNSLAHGQHPPFATMRCCLPLRKSLLPPRRVL